jgi:hypothetical protein
VEINQLKIKITKQNLNYVQVFTCAKNPYINKESINHIHITYQNVDVALPNRMRFPYVR